MNKSNSKEVEVVNMVNQECLNICSSCLFLFLPLPFFVCLWLPSVVLIYMLCIFHPKSYFEAHVPALFLVMMLLSVLCIRDSIYPLG